MNNAIALLNESKNILLELAGRNELVKDFISKAQAEVDAYNHKNYILIKWTVEDVQSIAPNLSVHECREALKLAELSHDCEYGIAWETLRACAEQVKVL